MSNYVQRKTTDDVMIHSFIHSFIHLFHRTQTVQYELIDAVNSYRRLQFIVNVCCWCGAESGRYVALDLGGTNFRVLLVELKGRRDERPNVVSKVFLIPLRIMLGTAQMASHSLIAQYSTVQYSTVQYGRVQYITVQYSTTKTAAPLDTV